MITFIEMACFGAKRLLWTEKEALECASKYKTEFMPPLLRP